MAIHNAADNSFKLIFDDHRLFADFLRDFVNVDILKDVKPEDIEDMREWFIPLFQEQRDADTVKRVNLKGGTPFFVIAILEHQSEVNFRTCFKMLLYTTLVLTEWEKEAEKQKPGSRHYLRKNHAETQRSPRRIELLVRGAKIVKKEISTTEGTSCSRKKIF